MINDILQNQLNYFYNNAEMQKLILWEISENSKAMREVSEERERLGSQIFKLLDKEFKYTDIRSSLSLIGGGHLLYGTSCEIDRYIIM